MALLLSDDYLRYVNVWQARTLGVDAALGWTVPGGDWLALDGRVTYQDVRNTSDTGEFADRQGDRMPNMPYLLANAKATFRLGDVFATGDQVALSWNSRYVHSFYLMWESLAQNASSRLTLDDQLSHALAVTYRIANLEQGQTLLVTLEGQNLTNADLFDFYGVQRPGRAFFAKVTLDL